MKSNLTQQQMRCNGNPMMRGSPIPPPPPPPQQQLQPEQIVSGSPDTYYKLGNVYVVGYLGSAILTKGKTGLGCLQQPLRELYYIYRQNGTRLLQERRLIISLDGITMLFNEFGIEKYLHNDLASVYDVQLLQLMTEQKKDKKLYCAFLPIEHDQEICYSNLFHPLDKQHAKLIENTAHPAIIALIMRRSTGIQALECHVLITRVLNDSIRILNEIRNVSNKYKYDLNLKTNVFQYKPYPNEGSVKDAENNLLLLGNRKPPMTLLKPKQPPPPVVPTQMQHPPQQHQPSTHLPPKSPFNKYQKRANSKSKSEHNDVIYDAFSTDNVSLQSASSKRHDHHSPSIFGKLKSNLSNKQKLTSSSAVNFSTNSPSRARNQSINVQQQQPQSRPASALAMPIQSSKTRKGKVLKPSSSTNSLANMSDDCQSIKSGDFTTKQKEKKQKLSIGKRILQSARSSLKSNSSSAVQSKQPQMMMSNSTTSLNTIASNKNLGDVDFRRSRTSMLDDNLRIDSNVPILPQPGIPLPLGCIQDSNFILRSRSPACQIVNLTNMEPPGQNYSQHSDCYPSQPPPPYVYQSPLPSMHVSRANMRRADDERHLQQQQPQPIPQIQNRYQRRNFNKPPCTDTKMFANHLAWNRSSKSAECLDHDESADDEIANEMDSFRQNITKINTSMNSGRGMTSKVFVRPPESIYSAAIARAVSPGFEDRDSRFSYVARQPPQAPASASRSKSYCFQQTDHTGASPVVSNATIITASNNQGRTKSIREKFELINDKASRLAMKDSAYNTNSSADDTDLKEPPNGACETSQVSSLINRLKLQHEEELKQRKSSHRLVNSADSANTTSISSSSSSSSCNGNQHQHHHKIIGGVKVFPSLPHERDRQAAEFRRQRLDEIEKSLSKMEKNSYELRQRTRDVTETNSMSIDLNNTTASDNNSQCNVKFTDEIIDLTRRRSRPSSQSPPSTEIPIEIATHRSPTSSFDAQFTHELNQKLKNSLNMIQSKGQYVSNHPTRDTVPEKSPKTNNNFVYYYDNDHFGGY